MKKNLHSFIISPKAAIVIFLCLAAAQCQLSAQSAPPQASGYGLAFVDNFNVLSVSPTDPALNPQPQEYWRSTWYEGLWWTTVHAPMSHITASKSQLGLTWSQDQSSPDTTITTLSPDKKHFRAWRYGYFEARMKWDVVNGAWPAFWMIPVQSETQNGVTESGELDIFEGIGSQPKTFFGTVHDWVNNTSTSNKNNAFPIPADADFSQLHLYGVLWTPGSVSWYFDNQLLHTENTPIIFDREDFYIVLGMQEGVNWTMGDRTGVTAPKMTLTVDWVRLWQNIHQRR